MEKVTNFRTSASGNTSVSMKRMFAAISTVRKNSAMAMLRDAKIDLQREPDEPTDIGKEKKSVARKSKRSYGSGCLIKRGRGFTIRWRETEIMPDGGKRLVYRCESLGAVSRKKAVEVLNERIAQASTQRRTVMTFGALAATWKSTILPMFKYSSRIVRDETIRNKLVPRFGRMELSSVTKQEVQSYIAELIRAEYAPHSIHTIHGVLSTILTKAVFWGYLKENPATGVDLPKLVPLRPKWVLEVEQANQLLAALSLLPRTVVALALLTGMRRGELFALRWKSFDEASGCLAVTEAVYRGHFDTPKTETSKRRLPLPVPLCELLSQWKQRSKRTAPDDLIFVTRSGKSHSPNNLLRRYVFPACERLGLPGATWLTFRRTYCSWGHDKGVPDKVIAQLMGHANVYTTLNVYTQVMPDSLCTANDRIGKELVANWSQAESGSRIVN